MKNQQVVQSFKTDIFANIFHFSNNKKNQAVIFYTFCMILFCKIFVSKRTSNLKVTNYKHVTIYIYTIYADKMTFYEEVIKLIINDYNN